MLSLKGFAAFYLLQASLPIVCIQFLTVNDCTMKILSEVLAAKQKAVTKVYTGFWYLIHLFFLILNFIFIFNLR